MDDKSLEMLEFPKVREILAGHTSFSASRDLALSLRPTSDPALISLLLGQSAEARRLLALQPDFSIRGAVDVRGSVELATRGKVLEPLVLLQIQETLAAARLVRRSIANNAKELPLLSDIAGGMVELPRIEEEIGRSISATGEVVDSASAALGNLRSQLKETQQQLTERLEAIIRSPRGRRAVQDAFVTERDGRYVIPLKSESRREIRGIVHDISNTGATVFVEPWSTVEMGNEVRELRIEERREVERILLALSADVAVNEEAISRNIGLLAELDLALAKARYSARAGANEPVIGLAGAGRRDGEGAMAGVLKLVKARHPLLGGKAVPLSVEIGGDYAVLVITGPNTGGKTVALKTVGLLSLMAQAGMPIPASEESCIPVFDGIYADIGDEQSIEQTISTFSWHMGNIVRILGSSTGRSLVLLDELGTSTDPNEGAALARAILLNLRARAIMAVATTHFSELKVFAHTTAGLQNASLDFDPVTLKPTYHLTAGIPGGSNALAVASQLGLSPEIIADARGMLAKGSEDIEMLLADLMSEKQKIESVSERLENERKSAEDSRRQYETELARLREEEQTMLRDIADRLARDTAELQSEVRCAIAELRKERSRENIERAERALAAAREQVGSVTSRIKSARGAATEEPGRIEIGDHVWLSEVNAWGAVLSIREEEGQIEVQVGHSRVRLNLEDAEKLKPPPGKILPAAALVRRKPSGRPISLELDLRGRHADEVLPELDRYLNDASLARLDRVRIIHGLGTGTVRQIVRDTLASHPLVRSFGPGDPREGGEGATVVNL